MAANKTQKLQNLNRKIDRNVYCCSFEGICETHGNACYATAPAMKPEVDCTSAQIFVGSSK